MFYTNNAYGPSMDIKHGLTLQRINCRCSLFSQDDQGTQAKGVMYCLYRDYKNEREYSFAALIHLHLMQSISCLTIFIAPTMEKHAF